MNRMSFSILPAALLAAGLFALPACSSDDPDEQGTPAETPDQTAAAVFTCVDDDFGSNPFGGPGYDEAQGGLIGPAQETYVVGGTLLRLKPDAASQQRFGELGGGVVQQLAVQEGLIGYQLGSSDKCGYAATITVWRDEESMMSFVMSDAHVAAMSEATNISDAGVTTTWEARASEVPPSWETARAKVLEQKLSY